MSETNRARKFDGFDRPTEGTPAVPESGLDRILEALHRSRAYFPDAIKAKLSGLWDRDTALAFAVLLAVWAGLQFTAAGWLADLLIAAYGLASFAADLAEVVSAAVDATQAETDSALEDAAKELAASVTESSADVIAGLIGAALFARFRRLVRLARTRLLPRRFGGGMEAPLTLADRLPLSTGFGAGVGLEQGSEALGQAKKDLEHTWDWLGWGVAIAGGVVLVGGLIALSQRESSP
jgi:hypothetical protein